MEALVSLVNEHLAHSDLALVLAVAAVACANHPSGITQLVGRAAENGPLTETTVARIGEALLKISSIAGYPRAINGLVEFKACFDDTVAPQQIRLPLHEMTSQKIEGIRNRGSALFDQVYERHSQKLRSRLTSASPDLMELIIQDQYGHLLSDETILNAVETELVVVAGLVPLNVSPQLRGHMVGALNVGASQAQVDLAVQIGQLASKLTPPTSL